jgi:hypothetical protein
MLIHIYSLNSMVKINDVKMFLINKNILKYLEKNILSVKLLLFHF